MVIRRRIVSHTVAQVNRLDTVPLRPAVKLCKYRRPFLRPASRLLDDAANRISDATNEKARLASPRLNVDTADPPTVIR